jgi:hypothetical protein
VRSTLAIPRIGIDEKLNSKFRIIFEDIGGAQTNKYKIK